MEGWTSQKELNWELEFAILVTEDTSSKVHQQESAKKLVVGTKKPQLAKVCLPMQESTQHILLSTGRTTHPFTFAVTIFLQNKNNLQCVYQRSVSKRLQHNVLL